MSMVFTLGSTGFSWPLSSVVQDKFVGRGAASKWCACHLCMYKDVPEEAKSSKNIR